MSLFILPGIKKKYKPFKLPCQSRCIMSLKNVLSLSLTLNYSQRSLTSVYNAQMDLNFDLDLIEI